MIFAYCQGNPVFAVNKYQLFSVSNPHNHNANRHDIYTKDGTTRVSVEEVLLDVLQQVEKIKEHLNIE